MKVQLSYELSALFYFTKSIYFLLVSKSLFQTQFMQFFVPFQPPWIYCLLIISE